MPPSTLIRRCIRWCSSHLLSWVAASGCYEHRPLRPESHRCGWCTSLENCSSTDSPVYWRPLFNPFQLFRSGTRRKHAVALVLLLRETRYRRRFALFIRAQFVSLLVFSPWLPLSWVSRARSPIFLTSYERPTLEAAVGVA